MTRRIVTRSDLQQVLDTYPGSQVPGIQYTVVDAKGILFEYAGGGADIQGRREMTLKTTLMAYSMTKTFTAVAVLQLVEQGGLGLNDEIDRYLPKAYRGHHISIRQLLNHTSGLPNPIPLRWVHLASDHARFDENAALAEVLRSNAKLRYEPGQKFYYSNIGYWLLGKVIEKIAGGSYADYVKINVLRPLGLSSPEIDFVIPDPTHHANGYLAKYSVMNLLKSFFTDSEVWCGYENRWLRLRNVYVNGPSFGGLVGAAPGFSRFLQDQLREESVLFRGSTKKLFEAPQTDKMGRPIPMTLGWHIGKFDGATYFFKEGGGGGFHSEMRIYPTQRVGSVVMVNSTQFDSTGFLNEVDAEFLESC
jgi:D-alanyl-D-alanine carboxypeptidase